MTSLLEYRAVSNLILPYHFSAAHPGGGSNEIGGDEDSYDYGGDSYDYGYDDDDDGKSSEVRSFDIPYYTSQNI